MKWIKIIVVFLVLAILSIRLPVAFRDYDASILNLFYTLRGATKPSGQVVLAAINDASIVEYGDWPWNRAKIAELVDSISVCNPSVIVLNFYFRKKSQLTTDDEEKAIVQNENHLLASAIKRAGNTVIPFNFEKFQDEQSVTALETAPDKIRQSRFSEIRVPSGELTVLPARIIHSPEPEIMDSATLLGFNNVLAGIRHYSLLTVRYGNDYYPSIAVAAVALHKKTTPQNLTLDIGNQLELKEGPAIPIDEYGITMINFCGPSSTFPNYTASEILGKNFNRELLKGKIVLLGLTDKRNSEAGKTPYSDNLPASELWANIIENMLSTSTPFIHFSSLGLMLLMPILIVLGLALLTHWCFNQRTKTALIAIGGAFLFLFLLSFVLFLSNQWLSVFIPLLYLLGLAGLISFRKGGSLSVSDDTSSTTLGSNTATFTPAGKLVRIGRYQVLQELGSGSMGTVYKAVDPKINRTIAIKTLKYATSLSGQQELRERFSREAHAAGTLSHPNIVTIYDYGETDNMSYIAMEYIEGKSLEEKLSADQTIRPEETCRIIQQIADGLNAAHKQGIIHRDIKPANIMLLGQNSTVKIMDFGVAKIDSATLTETGKTLGTPYYMSPEQINGEIIDNRTDIFSLGVIAFEALTGKKPFNGANLSALSYSILHKKHPDLTEFRPDLSAAANEVFNKVLSKDKTERYESAVLFANALSAVLTSKS